MRAIWQVFKYELWRNLSRGGFLFTAFGLPLIAYGLFFAYQVITNINSSSAGPANPVEGLLESDQFRGIQRAGYVDLSGLFADTGALGQFLTRYDDETAARAALDAGEIDVYYVIAPDYVETGNVVLTMPRFTLAQATDGPIRQLILENMAAGVENRDLFNRLVNPSNIREINLQRDATGETVNNFDTDFALVYLFALALMLSVFMTSGYLMQTVIEEKETRLIEILIATLRPIQLLAGKILALGVLGLAQIVIWIASILLLSRLSMGGTAPVLVALANLSLPLDRVLVLLVYFLLGYLFFAAAYGMVSAISTSMQEGPQFAVVFTLPAVIPLYFLGLFIESPDAPLVTILSLIPITAPISMVMRISITMVPALEIVLSLVLLLITDLFMIWLAGRMFRVNTLLAGQTPRLRDLPRLLRG